MKNLLLLFALLISSNVSYSQYLSDKAEISVLSYDPVNEIYTVFGHSSIRVYDPERQINTVFNYGMFDYAAPNFTLNFIKGKLNYELGVQDYNQVVAYSDYRNQSLYEQVLDLDSLQKQNVYLYLRNNYKPENRGYLYDFFYDNCATRIRDILDSTMTTQLTYDKSAVQKDISFRGLLQEFTQISPWLEFGIDLILGLPTDEIATFENQMFLPEYLNKSLAAGTVRNSDTTKALVKITRTLHIADEVEETSSLFTPTFVFWLIFGITFLLNIVIKKERLTNIWNGEFIFITGLAGIVMLSVWLGTDHEPTRNNLNVLWAFPLNIIAAFWIWRKRTKINYFRIITGLNALLLITFPVFPQEFAIQIIPILLTLLIIGLKYSKIDALKRFY